MTDSLHDTDSLDWAERQSTLLRRLSQGERVNDAIDWDNVIEEIHDVGLSQLNAVRSLLRQAMVHLLKIRGWPEREVRHWRNEILVFLADAEQRYSPSMRQRIALDRLYGQALDQVLDMEVNGLGPAPLPTRCPFDLDRLLADRPDIAALIAPP